MKKIVIATTTTITAEEIKKKESKMMTTDARKRSASGKCYAKMNSRENIKLPRVFNLQRSQ